MRLNTLREVLKNETRASHPQHRLMKIQGKEIALPKTGGKKKMLIDHSKESFLSIKMKAWSLRKKPQKGIKLPLT